MHPGRILGIVMGLVILVSVFLLPFASSQSLYSSAGPLLRDTSMIQQSGVFATVAANYILVIAFVLLVIAGVVGVFPLGTGVLGVVAMAMVTVGSILIYPGGPAQSYDVGFYVIWAASVISLLASFLHRRKDKAVTVNSQTTVNPPPQS